MRIELNGFEVDARLARLMSRGDWPGRCTDDAWLDRFPAHPSCEYGRPPFVQVVSAHHLAGVNTTVRNPDMACLCGRPKADYPPGNFDPTAGYIIGCTDRVDSAICVDLRPVAGPHHLRGFGRNEPGSEFERVTDIRSKPLHLLTL